MPNTDASQLRAKMLGVLMQDARKMAGVSQSECARSLGIRRSTLSGFEAGRRVPSLPELEALAYTLKTSVRRFLQPDGPSGEKEAPTPDLQKLVDVRQRMIAVRLKQERKNKDLSRADLSRQTGIPTRQISSYESGNRPIPLPDLEALANATGVSLEAFLESGGPLGEREAEHRDVAEFLRLPPEVREFVGQPINEAYLRLAMRMSQLPAERLRTIAEGLLEITL